MSLSELGNWLQIFNTPHSRAPRCFHYTAMQYPKLMHKILMSMFTCTKKCKLLPDLTGVSQNKICQQEKFQLLFHSQTLDDTTCPFTLACFHFFPQIFYTKYTKGITSIGNKQNSNLNTGTRYCANILSLIT